MAKWCYPMWILHMEDELKELNNRIKRLKEFKDGERFKTLPTADKDLMNRQLAYMEGYSFNLTERLKRSKEHIDSQRGEA